MTPTLALGAGLVLVAALLWMGRRTSPATSPWLWVPTLWFAIMGSRMLSLWFDAKAVATVEDYSEGSALDRNIFILLMVSAAVAITTRRENLKRIVSRNSALAILLYCALSITWSDYPLVSFKRFAKNVGDILMILVILTETSPIAAIVTVMTRCAYTLIPLSIVLYKYFPDLGRNYDIWSGRLFVTGVTRNKNELGVLAVLCGLFLIWHLLLIMRRRIDVRHKKTAYVALFAVFAMVLWTLVVANSATSIACFLVGVPILLLAPAARQRMGWSVAGGVALLVLALAIQVAASSVLEIGTAALGRDTTFTGRTELWTDLLAFPVNRLVGVGFGSFWLGDRMSSLWIKYWWRPMEAHNGYLEIYLELGIVGCLLLAVVVISSARKIFAQLRTDPDIGRLRAALLIMVLMYNVTESAFRVDLLMYLAFLLVSVDAAHIQARVSGVADAGTGRRARWPSAADRFRLRKLPACAS